MRARQFKLLYVIACAVWAVYVLFALLTAPSADRNPNLMGLVYCFLLLAVALPAFGYFLLFRALPWARRSIRITRDA